MRLPFHIFRTYRQKRSVTEQINASRWRVRLRVRKRMDTSRIHRLFKIYSPCRVSSSTEFRKQRNDRSTRETFHESTTNVAWFTAVPIAVIEKGRKKRKENRFLWNRTLQPLLPSLAKAIECEHVNKMRLEEKTVDVTWRIDF